MFKQKVVLGFVSSLSAIACDLQGVPSSPEADGQLQQAVYGVPGSTQPPAATKLRPGVGRLNLEGRPCVATLIHPRFAVGSSYECARFPKPFNDAQVTFTPADGSAAETFTIHDIRLIKNSYAIGNWMTDVALLELASPAPDTYPPSPIGMPPDPGAWVSSFGFGASGASGCATASDLQKRAIDWDLADPSYRVCWGDWGAPIFQGVSGGTGDLVGTILNPSALGNVARYRETLYQLMLDLSGGARYLSGTRREGPVLQTLVNTTTDDQCEGACLESRWCKAWNHSGTTCELLSYAGRWVPDATSSSGLRPLVDPDFSRKGNGSILNAVTTIGPQHCAAACQDLSTCKSWLFTPQSNTPDPDPEVWNKHLWPGRCNLYSGTGLGRQADPGRFSGMRLNRPSEIQLFGGTYKTAYGVVSDATCATRCSREAQCLAFTYFPENKRCELKDTINTSTGNMLAVSDFKRVYSLRGVNLEGDALGGDPARFGFYTPVPDTEEQCQRDCAADASCVAYVTRKQEYGRELECRLHSNVKFMLQNDAFNAGLRALLWQ
jgi:hypothetical protein